MWTLDALCALEHQVIFPETRAAQSVAMRQGSTVVIPVFFRIPIGV